MDRKRADTVEIVVTGRGMVTPVGHKTAQTCASIRAGITRLFESEEFRIPDERGSLTPVVCGAVSGITDGHRRYLRILRMAVPAFVEALSEANISDTELEDSGLYLCLSEQDRPGMDNRAEQNLAVHMSRYIGIGNMSARTQIFNLGHAGMFFALEQAFKDILNGKYHRAIIGAVDTYLDEVTLKFLLDFDRLKTETNNKGFIPGEGAAFVVLETKQNATRRNVRSLARVEGACTTLEENTLYEDEPCKGDGLSKSIQGTLASLTDEGKLTGLVISDLNGERYRSLEWGLAMPRVLSNNQLSIAVWHTADCLGDAGAAVGTVNLCLGVTALDKGYAKTKNILLWGSSDYGDRGSAYLRAL
jgi:3-oxoacyl-[acyl-carrier-protein] synthase-1